MSLIDLHNINKTYRAGEVDVPVLHHISFTIKPQEFVAIMGPSGSGKSTLLHILGLLDEPTGGTYKFEGRSIHSYSKDEIAKLRNAKIGFVFQSFNLLPRTSVLENVKLPLSYSGKKESLWNDLAKKCLDQVGLSHRLDHEPSQLSGGEQQRVAIARALVNNPEVIFADEPTGNLDSKSGQAIMEILQKLNDDGKTVILITHETNTAKHAQRIIRILDGEVESDTQVDKRLKADTFEK